MPEPATTRLGLQAHSGTDDVASIDNTTQALVAQLEALGAAFDQGTNRPPASLVKKGWFYVHTGTSIVSYCTGSVWIDLVTADSDLAALAALSTTAYGRSLLEAANAAALRALAGAETAGAAAAAQAASQPLDADLTAIAGLAAAANKLSYFTGAGAAALTDLTAFIRTLLGQSDAAAARAALGTPTFAPESTVTSLPGSPVDGQEVYYLADAANGIVWHLKYRAASASAYKWEYVGGERLFASVDANETTAITTYTNLATVGPSITTPLAGDYIVEAQIGEMGNTTAGFYANASFAVGGTVANQYDRMLFVSATANNYGGQSRLRRKTGVPAASAIVMKYHADANTARFEKRELFVKPVRVG